MTTIASLIVEINADDRGLQSGLAGANRSIGGFARGAVGALAALGALKIGQEVIQSAIEWESAFAGVKKTVEGTPEQMAALGAELRALATDVDAPVAGLRDAHVVLAGVAEAAGQLGIKREAIAEFTEVMGELGLATNLTAEEAAFALAQFTNITGTAPDDIRKLGNVIVELGNNSATTEKDIVNFAQRLAGAGASAGLTEPEILALSAAMASVGLNAEAGGTAMTTVLNNIGKAVADGGSDLQTFADTAGLSAQEFSDTWKGEPIAAIQSFVAGLGQMDQAAQLQTLDELGLSGIRVSDTLRRLAGNSDLVANAVSMANTEWEKGNALQDEAAQRFKTTEAQINLFKNNLNDLAVSLGNILLPVVNDVVSKLTGFLQSIDIEGGLAAWTGAFENAKLAWEIIWQGVQTAWETYVVQPMATLQETISAALGEFSAWINANIVQPIATLAAAITPGLNAFFGVISKIMGAVKAIIDDIAGAIASVKAAIDELSGGLGAAGGVSGHFDTISQHDPGDVINAGLNAIAQEFGLRASGGPVGAGRPYIVGERGPELFVPQRSGTIMPNGSFGGGGSIVINAYGESPHEVLQLIERAAGEKDF